MSVFVVWMDSAKAKVFHIVGDQVELHQEVGHSAHNNHNHNDAHNKDNIKFFDQIAAQLTKNEDRILVVGPGQAKSHFLSHLEGHHHKALAERIVGMETMDHPTDAQVVGYARKYFPTNVI